MWKEDRVNVLFLAHSLPITKRKRNTHVLRSIDQNTVLLLLLLPNGGDQGFQRDSRERETERKNICVQHRAWSVRRRRTHMRLGFENVDKKP